MATPFLSEIRIFSFTFAPKGWAMCNGQIMAINQNAALFSLLGTTYGGNGTTTFALPNLQGRMPIHEGTGYGGMGFALGQVGGEQTHTLSLSEMPQHTHSAAANPGPANAGGAPGNFWANGNQPAYASSTNATLSPATVNNIGGNQPHNNMAPYLVLNFCIALTGIFPSQN
jgi:microcystin-dependent protein